MVSVDIFTDDFGQAPEPLTINMRLPGIAMINGVWIKRLRWRMTTRERKRLKRVERRLARELRRCFDPNA